ncbi:MAG: hypothetical protein ACRDJP_01545 [Actinomycetota bacterium]
MQKSERRAMLRGYLLGALATTVVATLTGGTAVSADGGDETLIHACIHTTAAATDPNTRIVEPDEECPVDEWTPLHWPAGTEQLSDLLQGDTPSPEEIPPPPPKLRKKLYKPLGVKTNNTKVVTGTDGPEPKVSSRSLTVSCPASHPFVLWGSSKAIPVPPRKINTTVVSSAAVGWHAWAVTRNGWGISASPFFAPVTIPWTLEVTVECAKVAKPKETIKL